MRNDLSLKLKVHWASLILELMAGLFISLEALRLDAMIQILGFVSFAGEPPKYHAWYYHAGLWGFLCLILGILLSALALRLEHGEISSKKAAEAKADPQLGTPRAPQTHQPSRLAEGKNTGHSILWCLAVLAVIRIAMRRPNGR